MAQKFTVRANADWQEPFVLKQDVERWRLDDYDVEMHIKAAAGTGTALVTLSPADGSLVIVDPVEGRVEVFVPRETFVSTLPPGSYVFDFHLTRRDTDAARRFQTSTDTCMLVVVAGVTYPEA
ncbi:hypothetical protein [Amorphus sp. MBR-141]